MLIAVLNVPALPTPRQSPQEILDGVMAQVLPELIKVAGALAGIAIIKNLLYPK